MTNIFVGNLSYDTTDSDLNAAFGRYGAVQRASVVRDRDTGQSRGFGFVEMTNSTEAAKAMSALNGQDLNGRTLNVNEARPRADGGANRSGQNRNSGGGGGRRRERGW
jgi:RNA recognition motif-containing protein